MFVAADSLLHGSLTSLSHVLFPVLGLVLFFSYFYCLLVHGFFFNKTCALTKKRKETLSSLDFIARFQLSISVAIQLSVQLQITKIQV